MDHFHYSIAHRNGQHPSSTEIKFVNQISGFPGAVQNEILRDKTTLLARWR